MGMRAAAKRLRDDCRSSFLRLLLHRSLSVLEGRLRAGLRPGPAVIAQLVRAWGNEAWSADAPFLRAMLDWLPRTSGSIAECGSGLSTLLLASALARTDRRVVSFEHDPMWAARIKDALPERLRSRVEVSLTPLQSYGDFDWYSVGRVSLPPAIGFVVCDGPPGSTRGGRYGVVPVLKERFAPGCILLLDDTQRPQERLIMKRWCSEMAATVVQREPTFSVMRVGCG